MANSAEVDKSIITYRLGWYPVFLAFGLMLTVTGLAGCTTISAGGTGDATQSTVGFAIVA